VPSIIDTIKGRLRSGTSHSIGQGGLLSSLTGGSSGGGILSTAMGPLQSRLASIQAAGSPGAKLQALGSTLGARLRTPGGLLSGFGGAGAGGGSGSGGAGGSTGSATGASTDVGYQVSSSGRVYGSPTPPPGIQYR